MNNNAGGEIRIICFSHRGANQCVMGARLGARAVIVGKVGDDEHGKAYTENLRRQNVDLTHLGVEKVNS